jgi:hypothetical protein
MNIMSTLGIQTASVHGSLQRREDEENTKVRLRVLRLLRNVGVQPQHFMSP